MRGVTFSAVTKMFRTFKTCIRRLQILSCLEEQLGRGRKHACRMTALAHTLMHSLWQGNWLDTQYSPRRTTCFSDKGQNTTGQMIWMDGQRVQANGSPLALFTAGFNISRNDSLGAGRTELELEEKAKTAPYWCGT